jgi:hypothetical protein
MEIKILGQNERVVRQRKNSARTCGMVLGSFRQVGLEHL